MYFLYIIKKELRELGLKFVSLTTKRNVISTILLQQILSNTLLWMGK